MKILICDIDGVLADCEHRLHFIQNKPADWDGFFEACEDDEPVKPMIELLKELQMLFNIYYITGRPERIRNKTIAWFDAVGVPWQESVGVLLMRQDGDHRPDHIVKGELLEGTFGGRAYVQLDAIAAVIEDRDAVVQMWRKLGLLCLQPKDGKF